MGKKSKKQTIGYKYYVGMHMILTHGPIDFFIKLMVDKKTVWSGMLSSGLLYIHQPELFGGEKREGGIEGYIDLESGSLSQGKNGYLQTFLGTSIPAFRKVSGLVLRRVYQGTSPYLKPWSARIQRIFTSSNGAAQWYSAKAAIPSGSFTEIGGAVDTEIVAYNSTWEYITTVTTTSPVGPGSDLSGGFSGISGQAPFGDTTHPYNDSALGFPSAVNTIVDIAHTVWIKKTVYPSTGSYKIRIKFDNIYTVWINGVNVTSSFISLGSWVSEAIFPNTGSFELIISCYDSQPTMFGGNRKYLAAIVTDIGGSSSILDMNPAHIIRECLTDTDWGLGYLASDVDDTSFTACANYLYSERMGISILWDRQTPIEDFVKEIIRHINATLYIDRVTGKFTLKLIRNNYSEASLLILGEADITKVESYSRASPGELTNSVTVNFWDTSTGNDASVQVQDAAMIQMQGSIISATMQYPGFTNYDIATRAAMRNLQAMSTQLLSCTIFTTQKAATLNIGDVFKFEWPDLHIGYIVMRVNGLALGDGRQNTVRVSCIQDVFNIPDTPAFVVPPTSWVDPAQPPTPALYRLVNEAPFYELVQMLGHAETVTALTNDVNLGYLSAACVRSTGAINASLYVNSGSGYVDSGEVNFSGYAKLLLAVNKSDTVFNLQNQIDYQIFTVGLHAQIDDELVVIKSVSQESITVGRGVLDTVPTAHEINAVIICWDNRASTDEEEYANGETINVKMPTANGSGILPLASAASDALTFAKRASKPYAPGNFKINGNADISAVVDAAIALTWSHRDRLTQSSGAIFDTTYGDIGPEAGTTYSIRLYNHITSALLNTVDGLSGTSHSSFVSPTGSYTFRMELWSVRGSLASFQKHVQIFTYTNVTYLTTEATDRFITEAGDKLTTE